MAIKDRWNRLVRKSGFSTSSTDSSVLSKTLSWRNSKASTSTAATSITSSYSDRGIRGSSSSSNNKAEGVVGTQPGATGSNTAKSSAVHSGGVHQSKPCHKMQTLDDNSVASLVDDIGISYSSMSEAQRHQARLNAFTIKFGATRLGQLSLEEISPCNTRSPSLDIRP